MFGPNSRHPLSNLDTRTVAVRIVEDKRDQNDLNRIVLDKVAGKTKEHVNKEQQVDFVKKNPAEPEA